MGVEVWLTVAVLVALFATLVLEKASPAATVLGAVVALVLLGVLSPEDAFLGFANPATVTVAGLFVLARAVQDHAGVERLLARLLGDGVRVRRSLVRLVGPVAGASAVIANTPLVAAAAPMVREWADRRGVAPSRYLMPVSFAAILGGTITTIGTSVTLLVSGLVARATGEPLGLLEITPVGLPVALVGGAVLVAFGPRLLPDRRPVEQREGTNERDYSFHLRVEPGGPLDGRTVAEAGLRDLDEAFLAHIDRGTHAIAPVGPDDVLGGGDDLLFVGRGSAAKTLVQRPGLKHSEEHQVAHLAEHQEGLFEAVLGRGSALAGRTLKDTSFRGRYDAAVLAIHRDGERVEGKLGTVTLHPGDTLLVQADRQFATRWRDRGDFAVVARLDDDASAPSPRRPFVLAVVAAMVAAAATGLVPIVTAVLGACALLVATRTVTFAEARDGIDLDVMLVIGGAIGLGAAVETSGLAGHVAGAIASVADAAGAFGALAAVLVGTLVLTELVTNAAAAALMVPIALDVAGRVGGDPRGYAIAVALAASSSYLTPIGYQTNTIVYGLGGYRFTDYVRVGLPITLSVLATALLVIPAVWTIG